MRGLTTAAVVLGGLLSVNNLLPYLGVRDDSCQTMFSGLDWKADSNNHYLAPQRAITDLWDYYGDVEAHVSPWPGDGSEGELLVQWLNRSDREANTEAVRVAVAQLCDAGHAVQLRIRRRGAPAFEDYPDACAVPFLSRPSRLIPVRLYETDRPPGGW